MTVDFGQVTEEHREHAKNNTHTIVSLSAF